MADYAPSGLMPTRNGLLDLAKWVGSIGIVWFHIGLPGADIGYAALPFFVAYLAYFGVGRPLADRARRLLVPWVIWSAIFAVAKVLQAMALGTPIAEEFS